MKSLRYAVEKRRAEFRGDAARNEMRNVVENANILDQRGGDYKINSTFETASGTTNVEIRRSKQHPFLIIGVGVGILVTILLIFLLVFRS